MKSHSPKGKLNYSRITSNIYIGTNQCCQTHFAKELLKKGVRVDVSLEAERLDAPFGVKYYLWLPTIDHHSPTQKQLEVGITFLNMMVKLGEKVYVHCKNGHGRAPTLVAAYFISKGMTPGEAFRFIRKRRPVIHLWKDQEKNLKLFHKKLNSNNKFTKKLGKLLNEAKSAHTKYERSTGRRDKNWPLWYAEYISKKINK